jgi:LSD1 subclass zinc finger protein
MRGERFVLCVACNRPVSLPRGALLVECECGKERWQAFGSVDLSGFTEAEAEELHALLFARLGWVAADASAGRSDT